MAENSKRLEGVVVSYSDERGFGFIRDDAGDEYFVRFNEIVTDDYRTLTVGQRVAFEPTREPGTDRLQAVKVHPL